MVDWVHVEDRDRVWSERNGRGEAGFAQGLYLECGCRREGRVWGGRGEGKRRACGCWGERVCPGLEFVLVGLLVPVYEGLR